MTFSRLIGILSFIVTLLAGAGDIVGAVSPKLAIWVTVATATVSAFTAAVHKAGLDTEKPVGE
jgi:hypothetical protein